jgi:hypothetical protein
MDETLKIEASQGWVMCVTTALKPNCTIPPLRQAKVRRAKAALSLSPLASTQAVRPRTNLSLKHIALKTPSGGRTTRRWTWRDSTCFMPLILAHMKGGTYDFQDLFSGAEPAHRLDVRVVTELTWHSLFIRHLLRRPEASELTSFVPDFTIVNCPNFKTDPAKHGCRSENGITMNFAKKLILIGGTEYAGENKKSVFTLPNYLLPEKVIMPMNCFANHAPGNPVDTAVLFGLSGFGKTTLSADPSRVLIVTTNMAGPTAAPSISRAVATPRPSVLNPKQSPRSTPPVPCPAR